MASITVQGATRRYPGGVCALDGVDLAVGDGEFLVLVGPSGCGKSTLLRSLAGLERLDSGRVLIGDADVTSRPARDRDVAMVFQNYALYPQMSVGENLEFGLKSRGMSAALRRERAAEAAKTLGLEALLRRLPGELSGGQQQRVAMGRAIVRRPAVFLMDEPLSNLDATLRVSMRAELSSLHRRLGVTTVYVTHDQIEAMTLGDRVAVMHDGTIQQCDTPRRLFDHPCNLFVAAFIGSPAMNLAQGQLIDRSLCIGDLRIPLEERHPLSRLERSSLIVGLRPSDMEADAIAPASWPRIEVRLVTVEELGHQRIVRFDVAAPGVNIPTSFCALLGGRGTAQAGSMARLAINSAAFYCFDSGTGAAIVQE